MAEKTSLNSPALPAAASQVSLAPVFFSPQTLQRETSPVPRQSFSALLFADARDARLPGIPPKPCGTAVLLSVGEALRQCAGATSATQARDAKATKGLLIAERAPLRGRKPDRLKPF